MPSLLTRDLNRHPLTKCESVLVYGTSGLLCAVLFALGLPYVAMFPLIFIFQMLGRG